MFTIREGKDPIDYAANYDQALKRYTTLVTSRAAHDGEIRDLSIWYDGHLVHHQNDVRGRRPDGKAVITLYEYQYISETKPYIGVLLMLITSVAFNVYQFFN